MITFQLEQNSKTPLYQQLYSFIKHEILNGNLRANEKLPSKRNLAKNLGISILTVETAFSQLSDEGFIYSLPKKGFFTAEIKNIFSTQNTNQATDVQNLEEYQTLSQPLPKTEINFSDNRTEPESFPFSVWAKIIREILNQNQKEVMQNSPTQGTLKLRLAIAKHLREFRGMTVNPDQIVIGAGTEYLYTLLIQLFGFNKIYAVEDPCHTKIKKIYNSFGIKTVHIPMDKNGIIIEQLTQQNAGIVHITPSHHFPTGIAMPVNRRYELLSWASEQSERYLLEDDYDSEFRFSGKPLPTLQSIDASQKVIYMNTFTKTLASTIRISYMILPQSLMSQFKKKLEFYSCTVPVIDQYTLAKFIDEGYFEKHINRIRKAYSQKREIFINTLNKYDTKKLFKIKEGNSGLHFLLQINKSPKIQKDITFTDFLIQKNIKLNSLSEFYAAIPQKQSELNKNTFIINYTSLTLDVIDPYIKKLCETAEFFYD